MTSYEGDYTQVKQHSNHSFKIRLDLIRKESRVRSDELSVLDGAISPYMKQTIRPRIESHVRNEQKRS